MPVSRTALLHKYIGAISLLGRVAAHLPEWHQDHYGIGKAMRDANEVMRLQNVAFRYCKSSDGGYAAFQDDQVEHRNPCIESTPVPKGKPRRPEIPR